MKVPAAAPANAGVITAPTAFRVGIPPDSPAPFIDLAIAGQDFKALLDTGASTSLIGDEVVHHLRRNAVRLRDRGKSLQLACGEARSGGDVRITVRWNRQKRRMRFVHLPGLTVPVILGRNFMSKTGIAVDIGMGGYREPPLMSLVPFAEPPAVALPTSTAPERRASGTPANAPEGEPPAGRPPKPLVAAAEPPPAREERIAELRALLANACELSTPEQDRLLSLLGEFKEVFTEQPG